MTTAYSESPNRLVNSASGIDFAYREVGQGAVPLVLLQHFRGNLDSWDPALVDELARDRRVIAFDNVGVGGSTGTTPDTIAQMARDAVKLLDAMEVDQADILGFSIGSFVAQEIALIRPGAVRRLVLASSAPQGGSGMHGWAPDVIGAVGTPSTSPEEYLSVFSPEPTPAKKQGRKRWRGCTPGKMTGIRPRRGKPGWRSTTQCVTGGSRITPSSSGLTPSRLRSSSLTVTATR